MFEELLHLLTDFRKSIKDHNRPQLNLKTSGSPLNINNKLIIEAGSLCNSDSVEEENEIEEQSGRPVQRQIPLSQRGKAKTVHMPGIISCRRSPTSLA